MAQETEAALIAVIPDRHRSGEPGRALLAVQALGRLVVQSRVRPLVAVEVLLLKPVALLVVAVLVVVLILALLVVVPVAEQGS